MKKWITLGCLIGASALPAVLVPPSALADGQNITASVVIAPNGKELEVTLENNEVETYECSMVLKAQTFAGPVFFGEHIFTPNVTLLPGGKQTLSVGRQNIDPSIPGLAYKTAEIVSRRCEIRSLATDPRNCGRLGHDCGGGACDKGACQPAVVQSGIVELGGFAVDPSGVYYTSNPRDFDARLLRCPSGGCTLQPDLLASGLQEGKSVQLGPDDVFFGAAPIQSTIRNSVYTCPKTGCITRPTSLFNSGLQGGAGDDIVASGNRWFASYGGGVVSCLFVRGQPCDLRPIPAAESPHRSHGAFPLAADATHVYFGYQPPSSGDAPRRHHLMSCPLASDCSAPALLAEDLTPDALRALDGTVYILKKGMPDSLPGGAVLTCLATGCGPAGPAVFISRLAYPTALAVDASGVYWYSADDETIATCPLSGCVGGARAVATGLKGVKNLALSGAFVYWSVPEPAGDERTRSAIYRVAK